MKLTPVTPAPQGSLSTVTWNAQTGEPTSLDWIYTYDTGSGNSILANMCEGLLRQTPSGQFVPALATAVAHPNPTTYVYTIRSGVKFFNGKPMTAADVAFSLNRHLSAKPVSYWAYWYRNVKSVAVTGPSQVTVHLTRPDVLFNELMSTPAGYVGEKSYIQAQGANYGTPDGGVMCTGPYKLQSWNKGTSITIVRNPNYWDPQLKPHVDRFVFSFLTDPGTLTNALDTGSIDGTWNAPLSGVNRLRSSTTGHLYLNTGTFVLLLELNNAKGPLGNIKMRRALKEMIDYQGIVKGILFGTGQPAPTATPSPLWGYDRSAFAAAQSQVIPAKQDLASARKLLKEVGPLKRPIVLAADASATPEALQTLLSLQSTAKQLGVDIKVRAVPTSTYANFPFDPKARAGVDAFTEVTTTDIPDPEELYIQALPESPYNYPHVADPPYDEYIRNADTISNPNQRAQLVIKGQTGYSNDAVLWAVISEDVRLFMNNRITGAPVSSLASIYYPWATTIGAAK